MSAALVPAWAALGERVLAAALVAAVLGGLVALLLRRVPALPPAWRGWIWWLVAARTLAELAGAPRVELAWLPAVAASAERAPVASFAVALDPPAPRPVPAPPAPPDGAGGAGAAVPAFPWRGLLGAAWAVVALAALARSARGLTAVRRRRARAIAVEDPAVLAARDRIAATLGVRRQVRLALSDEIEVPQVAGLARATILLPRAAGLSREELEMTLAHELAHVRRREGLVAIVPFLAERLFVWHPLLRLAASEYVLAGEQACDALVVSRLRPAPERYGRLLLRFARHDSPAPAAAAWPLVRRPLQRRLEMLDRTLRTRRPAPGACVLGAVLVLATGVPLRLVAATPPPALPAPAPATPAVPPAPAVPMATPPPAPPVTPRTALALPAPATAPVPPVPPVSPAFPAPPAPPVPPAPLDLEGLSLALASDGWTLSIDAPEADRDLARRLADADGAPALVFRRPGEGRRVVRDRTAIDAIRAVVEEQVRLAREQAGVAQRQAELAAREVREQARRAADQARAAADQARVAAESFRKAHERTRADLEEEMARLEARLAELRRELETGAGPDLERHDGERRVLVIERERLERDAARSRADADRQRDDAGRRIREILERAPAEPTPPQR